MNFAGEKTLLWLMLFGIVAGGVSGYLWGDAMQSVAWLGELFLTSLKMLIVPLVAASVITGVAGLGDVRKLGRLGAYSVAYYACTTFIAVSTGLLMANLWQPGVGVNLPLDLSAPTPKAGDVGLSDLILSLVHPNIIGAAAEMKLLPIIVFCIFFAAALSTLAEQGKPVIRFFEGLNEAMMTMVEWIMWFAPIGVFALIASKLGSAGGGEVTEKARGTGMQKAIGDLLTCQYCIGPRVAGALVYGLAAKPRQTRLFASVFALVAGSDFLHFAYQAARAKQKEIVERASHTTH